MRNVSLVSAAAVLGLLLLPSPVLAQQDHQHGAPTPSAPAATPAEPLPAFIPPVTDEMRQAAFPDTGDHRAHGVSTHYFVLADHLEWRGGDERGVAADVAGWVGRDLDRVWFRSEGAVTDDGLHDARLELLYGRAVSRWWDVVAGVRYDTRSGPDRTWAAVGIQGLAPYWFEVEATAYVGGAGRTELRLEAEYDLLLTNRLVLQPTATVDLAGKADGARRLGAGFRQFEGGLRLRYEVRREFAPYVGISWDRALGSTATLRREADGSAGDRRFVIGVRVWN